MTIINGGTAFITGSAQGIGKATALSLAKYGVNKLVLADIQTQKLEETANLIREKYPAVEVLALKVDVANEEEIKFGISEAVKFGGGRLDYAINNAAFEEPGLMTHEIPDEAFDRQIKVDLYGVWRCQKAEITAMLNQEDKGPREGRGRIINLSSAHGIVGSSPRDFNTPYSIAKHGVSGMTRCDGNNYGPKGLRINAICPGAVLTPMAQAALDADHDGILMDQVSKLGIPRFAQPEEMGDVIAFLCSPLSSYIQGACLAIDGGITAS